MAQLLIRSQNLTLTLTHPCPRSCSKYRCGLKSNFYLGRGLHCLASNVTQCCFDHEINLKATFRWGWGGGTSSNIKFHPMLLQS